VATSDAFRLHNPFRDAVDLIFTHPYFCPRDDARPEQRFMADVKLTLRSVPGPDAAQDSAAQPVVGLPFAIGASSEVELRLSVALTPPFKAGVVYEGEARLLSQRRLGGAVAIVIEVEGSSR
jgi:hypothetical protein